METKNISRKNTHLFAIIACIGLAFSCISIIRAFNEGKIYNALASDTQIDTHSILGQKIIKMQNTLQANDKINNHEYEEALQLISGTTAEDYYNRGTIQTLLAYKNALQNSISGLQDAQTFVAQAQQNFDIAEKLADAKMIDTAIADNKKTINSLAAVVDIKTCYGIGSSSIDNLKDITATIKNIKSTLDQEESSITKRASSLDTACYEKLQSIVDTSKEQVGMLQLQMEKNITKYITDFSDKIEDPTLCIQTPYENILPFITKGKKGLEEYQQLHQNTISALESNDSQSIQELCDQTKNDAQINQQIENSVQDLLQKLEDNTTENQQKQKTSHEVKYKDFFNENEKKVLQEIEKTNQGRINTILNIRGKGNYTPEKYINDMFNQFYGNSGDFINLHK